MTDENLDPKIAKFYELDEFVTKLIDTAKLHHDQAFVDARKKVLMDKKGMVDQNKLKDKEIREKFVDTMVESYLNEAKGIYDKGKWENMNEVERDNIMFHHFNTTKAIMTQQLNRYKDKYTTELHGQIRGQHAEQLEERLRPSAHGHLSIKDKKLIIDYTGSQGLLNEDSLDSRSLGDLLRTKKETGAVTTTSIEKNMGENYLSKKTK